MIKNLYRKLALQNMKSNRSTFGPFALCSTIMVAMFYMLSNIAEQSEKHNFYGGSSIRTVLSFGSVVCAIFSLFVILYTNSFLMKRRAKELGLYSMLGMEKKHIAKVLFWEISITGCGSIVVGLTGGVLFGKLMYLILLSFLKLSTDFSYEISFGPILRTVILFVVVFVIAIIFNIIRVAKLKPIELMRSSKAGEKEPKAKLLLAIIGLVCIGIGYYIALTTENPVKVMELFFVAVLFVIVGTYFLFISGSIAILKLLKRNKGFYYKKNHFVTVSGLLYRMKQNAVGLANICILSTAVLVVLFSTISLYIGTEESIHNMYPKDCSPSFYVYEDEFDHMEQYDVAAVEAMLDKYSKEYNVKVTDEKHGFSFAVPALFMGNAIEVRDADYNQISYCFFINAQDLNASNGQQFDLAEDQILFYSSTGRTMDDGTITMGGSKYQIAGQLEEKYALSDGTFVFNEFDTIVVKDLETQKALLEAINAESASNGVHLSYNLMLNFDFNLEGTNEDKLIFCQNLRDILNESGVPHLGSCDNIYTSRQDYINIYGSLFFIGIFLGFLFLMTTVMIIYYKQISEGYEDREKFIIMKKVGMSGKEAKSTIRSQILQVFFLPIILAVIHVSFAFPFIKKILLLFGLTNGLLLILCLIATVVLFLIVYTIVYVLTAKVYYRLVY